MGVDWESCTGCGESFPDCSSRMVTCSEDMGGCGRRYCGPECAKPQRPGHDRVPTWKEVSVMPHEEHEALVVTCVDCREELASDENLLYFVLKQIGKTREQIAAEYAAVPHE